MINYNLKDKVILVTGGTRGIGREITKYLIQENAKVAICARKQEGLDELKKSLGSPPNLLTVAAHIAKEEDVEKMFSEVINQYGIIDVLINNVGMNLFTPSITDTDFKTWQKIIDSNLNGTYLVTCRAARIMRERKAGKIVSVTSIAGHKASPGMGVYGIAKAAIEMMTKVFAAELAAFNVQVNAVAPAMVRTDFSKPFWSNNDIYNTVVNGIPMGRIAEINEIVHPILFLASEGSGFITGETLFIDGGTSAV